jgi:hypothetical protein
MKHLRYSFVFVMLLVLTACGGTGLNESPAPTLETTATNATAYGGRATVVNAKVLGKATVVLSDTGALPSSGGAREKSLLQAGVTNLLAAKVLNASTIGQGNHTRSYASIANLGLTVAGVNVKADFIKAEARASCSTSNAASVSGSSQLTKLVINGKSVTVTGSPNQTISVSGLANAKVIINQQSKAVSGSSGKMTVTALRVLVGTGGSVADVAVSSTTAQITCKTVRPSHGDFITGSGSIKANCGATCGAFSLTGGNKNGTLFGNLTYIDSAKNLTVRSTGVTGYTVVSGTTRLIKGRATVNGKTGFRYEVRASDNGAGSKDTFQITLFNSSNVKTYAASGSLICGNLQLHSTSPSCACR